MEYFRAQKVDGKPVSKNLASQLATFCRPPSAMRGGNKKEGLNPSTLLGRTLRRGSLPFARSNVSRRAVMGCHPTERDDDTWSNAETDQPLDKRRREMHPERITVGNAIYERNDIAAARFGETERTFNKRDRNGAPFAYFGGVKYRPLPDFDEHILSNIRRQRPQQPQRRRRSRAVAQALPRVRAGRFNKPVDIR